MNIREIKPTDLCIWPNGDWCEVRVREYVQQQLPNGHGDDYEVIPRESERAQQLLMAYEELFEES